jgi:hypothetical protein
LAHLRAENLFRQFDFADGLALEILDFCFHLNLRFTNCDLRFTSHFQQSQIVNQKSQMTIYWLP